ncbi:MAG: ferritin-like domain-containing protein [Chloroflexota bacterium]|nr:ferritin-like domain-containing protein [Chloroflexota bacterium]
MRRSHGSLRTLSAETPRLLTSRRGLLRGSVMLAGSGTLALAYASAPVLSGRRLAVAQNNDFFEDEVDVLNFALRLERLDSTLYRSGLEEFDDDAFVHAGYDESVRDYLAQIVENEETQVEFLTNTITDLGSEPVGEDEYTFPYTTLPEFLALSQQVEEVGLDAYTGAAQYLIDNDELLTAALTIHGVEARHLAYFRLLNGAVPFPEAFEAPLTPPEVLAAVEPFIVGGVGTPAAGGTS